MHVCVFFSEKSWLFGRWQQIPYLCFFCVRLQVSRDRPVLQCWRSTASHNTLLILLCCVESSENREKKRLRRSRWGSDAPQPSPASGPASMPVPGPAGLPGQPPMGFTPGGMSGYPPPGPPLGLRPPGVTMNPQLGAAAMPRPNVPGTGSKNMSGFCT